MPNRPNKVVLQTDYQPSDVAIFAEPAAYMDTLTQPSQFYYDYAINFNPVANEYAYIRIWFVSHVTAKLHENSPQVSAPFSTPAVGAYYARCNKVKNNPWGVAVINGPYTQGTLLSAGVDGKGYLLAQTVDVDYDGTPIPVLQPDERYFVKSLTEYAVEINIACNEASTYDNYHFATKDYNIVLSWTSLRTNETFAMSVTGLEKNEVSITEHVDIPPPVDVSLPTKVIGNIATALKVPPAGHYPNKNDVPTAFSDLQDIRSLNTVKLRQLVNYMNTESPGHTEQDVFTEIKCTFYEAGTTNVIEEKTVDYSSLFGNPDIEIDEGIPYDDPTKDPDIDDDNTYTDHIDLTDPSLTATGVFNRCYTLDGNGVNDLCDYLYNSDDNIFQEVIEGVLTRGSPIESLIDLRLYPFDVRQFTGGGTSQAIKFGRTVTPIIGVRLPHNANAVISLGHADIPRYANNFIDYEMEVHLYIPFCGTIDLPANRVVNHRISVKLVVDYVTGACTAVVYCDQIPIAYKQGVIGVSIPMTATDSAEYGKTVLGNLIKTGGGIVTGNFHEVANGVMNTIGSLYDGSHIETVGASSPQTSLFLPKNCYVMMSCVVVPEAAYTEQYASTVGYATVMPVNSIHHMDGAGFTCFENVKLENCDQATEEEKRELLKLLREGVYM